MVFNATAVMDTLALSQVTQENIRAICLEMGSETSESLSGILDLSRDNHSLASGAPSSPDTVAFSYCLPSTVASQGFLSIGAPRPEHSRHFVVYTPLRTHTLLPNMYVVRLTKLDGGGVDVKIPYALHAGNALFMLGTTFTYLMPDTYVILREQFKSQMTEYRVAPSMGDLDTCYNFTGLTRMSMPPITLWFEGWAYIVPGMEQMMYFGRRGDIFSVGCLAFAAASDLPPGITAVIGTLLQERTEVVYDVHGGKMGFSHKQCW
ncbi:hypothetical protein VPH35_049053 [Triticum aestivum]|uniref:Peptidase A1 domain-containing protein n=2 Tax=Triticum aestivum TaxID=4565 RepID=A0A077RU44_WHEAT|nr:unnamed protein product [Triticum aestivum]CDM80584.1 unnamed protein product [Triticum aestivum]